jgi:hypothetical protein
MAYPHSEADFTELVDALPRTLEILDLCYYVVTRPVQGALMHRISEPTCHIRELHLGEITEELLPQGFNTLDIPSFAQALTQNKSIRQLELRQYKFTSQDGLSLLNVLPYCPKLKEIGVKDAAIAELDSTLLSILPSSTLKVFGLFGFELGFDYDVSRTPEDSRRAQKSRDSMVAMLQAYHHWCVFFVPVFHNGSKPPCTPQNLTFCKISTESLGAT